MNTMLRVIVITLLAFALYFVLDELYFGQVRSWINSAFQQLGLSHILTYVLFGIPIFLGTILLHPGKGLLAPLGLNRSFLQGMGLALLFTVPMFIGYALVFSFNAAVKLDSILIGVVAAGFFEELYFRGFLFGQLYRFTRLGFIPSIILGALLFASVHLYQSQDFGTLVGIFMTTFLGAVLFAWMYCEWGFNLWVSIFLHLFMNLSWMLFSVSSNALGDTYANIFRVLTIVLAIGGTVVYKLRMGRKLAVHRGTIWMKGN